MAEKYFYNDSKTIVLVVDTEGSEASLKLSDKCLFFHEDEIHELVAKAGITYGFKNAQTFLKEKKISKELSKPFLIAKRDPVEPPAFEYDLLISKEKILSSDYRHNDSLKQILDKHFASQQEELLMYKITGEGESGKDVFGKERPAAGDEEIKNPIPCGEGVKCYEGKVISEIAGFPCLDKQNKLSVFPILTIEGDLELAQNELYNIPCSLFISGSIYGKGRMEITGDLALTGNVTDSSIYTSGKTFVTGTVENAHIIAADSIAVVNVKHSRIASGNSLKMEGFVEGSVLIAENTMIGDETSGCLDCSVFAGKSMDLASFSKSSKLKPLMAICYSPFYRELIAYRQNMKEIFSLLKHIPENNSTITQLNLDIINEDTENAELRLLENVHQATKEYYDSEVYNITVRKELSAGVKVRVFSNSQEITKDIKDGFFGKHDPMILPPE